jgi:hypothetical protein
MNPGISPGRRFALTLLAALAAACPLAPAAQAMSTAPSDQGLSPRLGELAQPSLQAASPAEQAEQLSLAANGPGSLVRDGNRVFVEVRFSGGAEAGVNALREAGAEIFDVSPRYQTVTVATRPLDLPEIGAVPGVESVSEVLSPVVRGANCGGAVTSEGDQQLNAAVARSGFSVDGSGVTVGIISDSFDRRASAATHASGDVASGDLPGPGSPCGSSAPVGVLADTDGEGRDEGRAMAQIVHDLAPGASIDFATAFPSETAFAGSIRALWKAGAQVIVDDIAYYEEPFFQDGPVAVAIDEATAAGVSYFSAAGNDNLIDSKGRNIASWEAPEFRDSGSCPPNLEAIAGQPKHCMDFKPSGGDNTFGISVEEGATLTVDLQWAEPWNGVKTDLDAYLLDSEGKPIKVKEGSKEFFVGSGKDNVGTEGTQRPVEFFQWKNPGAKQEVELAINDCFLTCNPEAALGLKPRLKVALLENGHGVTETRYPESSGGDIVGPTVYGHSGAAATISVGTVPYNNGASPERYSSRGPVTHYFGPVVGTSAANAISPAPISKPDLAATDCGVTTFFASQDKLGAWRFCGTSAAAPHAAAVAALMRQANPGASGAQVRADLTATARPVGAFGVNDVGAGLIDASAAVGALALPPTVTITKAPPALSRGRRPTVEFSANRPVAFSCAFDGREAQLCTSPFTVPNALADGHHGIVVTGVDGAGRSGSSAVSFVVDTRAPRTSFAKHPRKLIRTHRRKVRERFRFRSNESGVTFVCKFDRSLLHFCRPRISRRFGVGKHTVTVRASDGAGNIDRSPAVFHFRVKRVG